MNTEITYHSFVRSYWNYFLDLEEQLISTKRFVDFSKTNNKTFSIEYLKLLQATCSEIDVVAKILAEFIDADFQKLENKNIQKWGFTILNKFPDIENLTVLFNNDYDVIPWKKCGYEKCQNSKGHTYYRLSKDKGKETPVWWTAYNKVKHERTSKFEKGQTNYVRANLGNLVSAMAALFIFETIFLYQLVETDSEFFHQESKLFKLETI